MDLISRKEAIKKGIEHLVITEEDFQKYVQEPADEHEQKKYLYQSLPNQVGTLQDALLEEEN